MFVHKHKHKPAMEAYMLVSGTVEYMTKDRPDTTRFHPGFLKGKAGNIRSSYGGLYWRFHVEIGRRGHVPCLKELEHALNSPVSPPHFKDASTWSIPSQDRDYLSRQFVGGAGVWCHGRLHPECPHFPKCVDCILPGLFLHPICTAVRLMSNGDVKISGADPRALFAWLSERTSEPTSSNATGNATSIRVPSPRVERLMLTPLDAPPSPLYPADPPLDANDRVTVDEIDLDDTSIRVPSPRVERLMLTPLDAPPSPLYPADPPLDANDRVAVDEIDLDEFDLDKVDLDDIDLEDFNFDDFDLNNVVGTGSASSDVRSETPCLAQVSSTVPSDGVPEGGPSVCSRRRVCSRKRKRPDPLCMYDLATSLCERYSWHVRRGDCVTMRELLNQCDWPSSRIDSRTCLYRVSKYYGGIHVVGRAKTLYIEGIMRGMYTAFDRSASKANVLRAIELATDHADMHVRVPVAIAFAALTVNQTQFSNLPDSKRVNLRRKFARHVGVFLYMTNAKIKGLELGFHKHTNRLA